MPSQYVLKISHPGHAEDIYLDVVPGTNSLGEPGFFISSPDDAIVHGHPLEQVEDAFRASGYTTKLIPRAGLLFEGETNTKLAPTKLKGKRNIRIE